MVLSGWSGSHRPQPTLAVVACSNKTNNTNAARNTPNSSKHTAAHLGRKEKRLQRSQPVLEEFSDHIHNRDKDTGPATENEQA